MILVAHTLAYPLSELRSILPSVLGSYPKDANGGSMGVHYDGAAILTTLFMAFAVGYHSFKRRAVDG
jgi:hypothetical protein